MAVKPISEMDDEQFRKHYIMRHGDLPGFHEGEEPMRRHHEQLHERMNFKHVHRNHEIPTWSIEDNPCKIQEG